MVVISNAIESRVGNRMARSVRRRGLQVTARAVAAATAATVAAGFAGTASAQSTPITISNWNADLIADSAPIAASTNSEFDTANTPYGGGVYYYSNYQSSGGVPLSSFVSATNTGTTFQIANSSTNPLLNQSLQLNCVPPSGAAGGNGTGGLSGEPILTSAAANLSTPASYTSISVLSSVTNGQAGKNLNINWQMNFSGGATATGTFAGTDWTSAGTYAVNAYNVNRGNTSTTPYVGGFGGMIENDLPVPQADQSLLLQNITFTMANPDTTAGNDFSWGLFAVSGAIGSTGNFVWSGNISSPSPNQTTATWDTGTTANFTGLTFNAASTAIFGDVDGNNNPVANSNVMVTAAGVTPFNTTFNNSSLSYNVTGGAIMGSGALTQSGNGTTTIFNVNTYSGGTYVTSGTLIFAPGSSDASAFGSTSFVVGTGGTLIIADGSEQTFNGSSITLSITDNGTVTLNNSTGSLNRSASNLNGTGQLNLNGTILSVASGGFGGIVTGTGALILSGSYNFGSGSGGISSYSGGTTFQPNSNINAISNYAFGTGPLIFNGGGFQVSTSQFTINANNPFTNAFTFGATPTMLINGANPVDITGPGTLVAGANTITISNSAALTTLSGNISDGAVGSGMLNVTGPGRLTLTGNNGYTGGTNVSGGTLVLGSNNSYGGVVNVASGATLQVSSPGALGYSSTSSVNVASGGQVVVTDNSGTAGLTGGINGGGTPIPVLISGTGIFNAAYNSTYGALRGPDLASATYAGNIVIAQGGAYISGGVTGVLTLSGVISSSPASTNRFLDPVVFSAANASTTVLTGNSTYVGETQMVANGNIYAGGQSVGTLQIGTTNAINPNSGFVQVNSANADGLTLDLNGNTQGFAYLASTFHNNSGGGLSNYIITNSNGSSVGVLAITNGNTTVAGTGIGAVGPQTYANSINDGGGRVAVVKTGTGNQILSGVNSYSGGTTVSGGTLTAAVPLALGSGPVTMAGGTLALGSPQVIASVTGFTGFNASGGISGQPATINSGKTVATLTNGNASEGNSVFTSTAHNLSLTSGFIATFTYTDTVAAGKTGGDGFTFVLQNDSRGGKAVGNSGIYLGYNGKAAPSTGIKNSGAVEFETNPGIGSGVGASTSGTAFLTTNSATNSTTPYYTTTTPVNLSSGDPINISITYNPSLLTVTESLTDSVTKSTYSQVFSNVNYSTILNNATSGYIGFTGSTDTGAVSTQAISGFSFANNVNAPVSVANSIQTMNNTSSILQVSVASGLTVETTGGITINPASTLTLTASSSLSAPRVVLTPTSLTFNTNGGSTYSGKFDIGKNDLDLTNTSLSQITGYVATAYNLTGGGNWSGPGIISTAAATDTTHLTAIGVIGNGGNNGSQLYGAGAPLGLFDGSNPSNGDVLVKYTYFGDANLDGKVDGSDYSLIDAGYASRGGLTGWYNGDFNYDAVIDGSDYALIDNSFNNQGASQVVSTSVLVATSTSQVAGPASAVPEPISLSAAAIGLVALAGRRRRREAI